MLSYQGAYRFLFVIENQTKLDFIDQKLTKFWYFKCEYKIEFIKKVIDSAVYLLFIIKWQHFCLG